MKVKKYIKIMLLMVLFIGLSIIIPSRSYAAKYLTYKSGVWTTQSSESKYGMTDLALSFWNKPTSITSIDQDDLYSLLNARISLYETSLHFANKTGISSSELWNIDVPTAMCWEHWSETTKKDYTYKVYQIIAQELDTDSSSDTYGQFVTYNYYIDSNGKKHQEVIEGSDSNAYLRRLALAVYNATQEEPAHNYVRKYNTILKYLIYKSGLTLSQPIDTTHSSNSNFTKFYSSSSAQKQSTLTKTYKRITVTKYTTTASTTYNSKTIIGPIKITYGYATLEKYGVSASGVSSSKIKWAVYDSESLDDISSWYSDKSWSNNFSTISSGTKIWIMIPTTYSSSSINLTFTQKEITYYKSRILVLQTTTGYDQAQADLTYASKKKTYTGTYSIKVDNETYGKLNIQKYEYDGKTPIQNAGFIVVYKSSTSSDTYYWVSGSKTDDKTYTTGTYSSSKATTYKTNSSGLITLTNLQIGYYYIYEVSLNWDYAEGYYLEDQSGYKSSTDPLGLASTYGWVYCGYKQVTAASDTTPVTYTKTNKKSGKLTINKTGYEEETVNASFVLVYYDGTDYYWVYGDVDSKKTYTKITSSNYSSSTSTTYTTTEGTVTVDYLRPGTYYIYETEILPSGVSNMTATLSTNNKIYKVLGNNDISDIDDYDNIKYDDVNNITVSGDYYNGTDWNISSDQYSLSKTYYEDTEEYIILQDSDGNAIWIHITVDIDSGTISYEKEKINQSTLEISYETYYTYNYYEVIEAYEEYGDLTNISYDSDNDTYYYTDASDNTYELSEDQNYLVTFISDESDDIISITVSETIEISEDEDDEEDDYAYILDYFNESSGTVTVIGYMLEYIYNQLGDSIEINLEYTTDGLAITNTDVEDNSTLVDTDAYYDIYYTSSNNTTTMTQDEWNSYLDGLLEEQDSGYTYNCTYDDLLMIYNWCVDNLETYQYALDLEGTTLYYSNSNIGGYLYDDENPDWENWETVDEDKTYYISFGNDTTMENYDLETWFMEFYEEDETTEEETITTYEVTENNDTNLSDFNNIFYTYLNTSLDYQQLYALIDIIKNTNNNYNKNITVNDYSDLSNFSITEDENWDNYSVADGNSSWFEASVTYDSSGYINSVNYVFYSETTCTGEELITKIQEWATDNSSIYSTNTMYNESTNTAYVCIDNEYVEIDSTQSYKILTTDKCTESSTRSIFILC